jgi:hypothetical protein
MARSTRKTEPPFRRHTRTRAGIPVAAVGLLAASLACNVFIDPDPMFGPRDEIDEAVDWGGTLQAQETATALHVQQTATARARGPEKEPVDEGENVPILPDEDQPAQPQEESDAPEAEEEEEQTVVNFGGSWHGPPECGEADAPYRWKIELQHDPDTNYVHGTISFHDCPGGGRVSYSVAGYATPGAYFVDLEGTKQSGRGGLGGSAPATQTFRIRPGMPPEPNMAP